MPRVALVDPEAVPELAPLLAFAEQSMGFVPNSLLVMGRWPELVRAFGALAATVLAPRHVPAATKQLVAFVASTARPVVATARPIRRTQRGAAGFPPRSSPLRSSSRPARSSTRRSVPRCSSLATHRSRRRPSRTDTSRC